MDKLLTGDDFATALQLRLENFKLLLPKVQPHAVLA